MFSVYGMVDPRDKSYFYVGCTSRPVDVRGYEHVRNALHGNSGQPMKNRRILDIIEAGFYPYAVEIESQIANERLGRECEFYWIWKLAREGHILTNRQWNKYTPIPR